MMHKKIRLGARAEMNEKRWAILKFLADYSRNHDYCPGIREIMDAVGISSTSVTSYYINPMRDAGLIDGLVLPTGNTAPRSLRITETGRRLLGQYLEGDIDG